MLTHDTIKGVLSGTDYGDNEERDVEAGTYTYTLKATDTGKLAFKVEQKVFPPPSLDESNNPHWRTIEEKSKIQGGSTLRGSFVAGTPANPGIKLRFNFNREFLGHSVGYDLTFEKQ